VRVVVITGSRDWQGKASIELALEGAELLIVGDARGADQIALVTALEWDIIPAVYCASEERYELLRKYEVPCFMSANWKIQRKQAGLIRNAAMVRRAFDERAAGMDVHCHAFPGPKSVGTIDCAMQLAAAGFDVNGLDPALLKQLA
jgi:hypothetical protein